MKLNVTVHSLVRLAFLVLVLLAVSVSPASAASKPEPPGSVNPACGKTWNINYNAATKRIDTYVILGPGNYSLSLAGHAYEMRLWYYGDPINNPEQASTIYLNGQAVDTETQNGETFFSGYSEHSAVNLRNDRILTTQRLYIAPLPTNIHEDDNFTIKVDC